MTIPNPKTAAGPAVNPWSTATKQVTAWYTAGGELIIGIRDRATQRWGVNHQQYQVAGTPRTVLALPVEADEHNYPSVCVDGNDRIHVWANMHNEPMRYIRSVDPIGSGTWTSDSGWTNAASELTGVLSQCTYPTPLRFPDGSLAFYLRNGNNGLSGQSDSYWWTRTPTGTSWSGTTKAWQGNSVPDAGGVGVPGADGTSGTEEATNWSAYPTNFYVENARDSHPGRVHVSWCWRSGGVDGQSNVIPSYAYSDDKGSTWRAVDGTTLTVPMTPLNNHACRINIGSAFLRSIARDNGSSIVVADLDTTNHGFIVGDSISVYNNVSSFIGTFTVGAVGNPNPTSIAWVQAGATESGSTGSVCKFRWFNWGGITVDPTGLPHIVVSTSPARYMRRNASNTAWVISTVSNPVGGAGGPISQTGWPGLFWWRAQLWGLTTTWDTPQTSSRAKVRLVRLTGGGSAQSILLSGDVGDSNWDPMTDPEAWARFGVIDTFAPDGDSPRLFTFGNNHRRRAVA